MIFFLLFFLFNTNIFTNMVANIIAFSFWSFSLTHPLVTDNSITETIHYTRFIVIISGSGLQCIPRTRDYHIILVQVCNTYIRVCQITYGTRVYKFKMLIFTKRWFILILYYSIYEMRLLYYTKLHKKRAYPRLGELTNFFDSLS